MTEQHELDGPQPFLAYVRCRITHDERWAIARHVSGDTEWWCNDECWRRMDGEPAWRLLFISLASARAYANERGWE